jgi:hypothetical protein
MRLRFSVFKVWPKKGRQKFWFCREQKISNLA